MTEPTNAATRSWAVGVLCGLDPMVTARFFELLVEPTPADSDQEYSHIIVNNKTQIPAWKAYLTGNGSDL